MELGIFCHHLQLHFGLLGAAACFLPPLSLYQLQAAKGKQRKRRSGPNTPSNPPSKNFFSLFTRNTFFLIGGGFTDSDESDSYAGDLPDGPGDLFTRVRRFQGSTGPPSGGPGFQAGPPRGLEQGPPRGRPGFMFPPPPAGPPPEPGDLYSVLQCKEFNIATKKHKFGTLLTFRLHNKWRLSVEFLFFVDAFQGNSYEFSTSEDSVKNCMSIIYPDLCFLML